MTKRMQHMKPLAHEQRKKRNMGTALEQSKVKLLGGLNHSVLLR